MAAEQQKHRDRLMASEQERHHDRLQRQHDRASQYSAWLQRQQMREQRREEREQKHYEWLQRQEEREQKRFEWLQRQEEREKRRADWERRHAVWQRHEARRAAHKQAEASDESSTVASEGVLDDWTAPAPMEPALPAPVEEPALPAPVAQPREFTMDEWKQLLKVKKVLREIAVIDGMLHEGKTIDVLQAAKLQRRADLEGCLVMVQERAGYAKPSRS